MSGKFGIALKSLSLVLVVCILSAFVFRTTSDLNQQIPGYSPGIGRATFKVGNQVVTVGNLSAPASPKPAASELPKLNSLDELLGIFNQMGLLYQPTEDSVVFNGWDKTIADGGTRTAVQSEADMAAGTPAPMASPAPSAAFAASDEAGFSQTNSQVSGVDEGDIIKTDGRYIYAANGQSIRIIEVSGADMRVAATISLEQSDKNYEYFSEMYVSGDHLVTVSTRSETIGDVAYPDAKDGFACCIWYPQRQFTCYTVYDLTDRANPQLFRKFEAEGGALATRMIGNRLYFVTNKYVYSLPAEDMGEGDVLPMYRDSALSGDMRAVPVKEISYIPGSLDSSYMMAGSFDIDKLDAASMETVLGAGNVIYMSQNALYVTRQVYTQMQTDVSSGAKDEPVSAPDRAQVYTEIHRFSVGETGLYYSGMGQVEGYPLNQYSMDEYDGYFRIATSDWSGGNKMTILDADLKLAGQTENLAPGEQIYSVRFMGDIGYMVTYRQVDPLFAIDLSDPKNPTVLGQLKIPGFSQYLHPVGDGLMVGFGRHTAETYVKNQDGTETVVGAMDMGLKISLFDVSDPTDPKEIDTMLLGENSWTAAFDNPRAMMVDPSRSLFGFAKDGGKVLKNGTWTPEAEFVLVSVQNKKLMSEARLALDSAVEYAYEARLCYIGQTLYGVTNSRIAAFDYTSFKQLGTLSFAN